MKYIFILSIIVFVLTAPSQAQKDADLSEDIAALKNDIKDLETEIADAKINYPEDVPELQKELAATKKMLAAFEKMAGVSSTPQPEVVKTVPIVNRSNNSPIVQITLNQPVTAPSPDEATDRLLWYTGKKINDSTLVTARAMVVQYQHSKNRVVTQPDPKSDSFKHLVEELEKSEQRKDELIDKFIKMKNGTLYYPNLIFSLKVYDDLEKRYSEAVKNTIDLPDVDTPDLYKGGAIEDIFEDGASIVDSFEHKISDEIQDVITKIKEAEKRADEMEAQLPPWDQFPAPPRKQNDICSSCDSKIIKKEHDEDSIWRDKFQGKEEEILTLRLGVERQKAFLGINDDTGYLGTMLGRMSKKIKLLEDKYGDKPEYLITVIPIIVGLERQKQLLGFYDEGETHAMLANLLGFDYPKYLKEQMGLKNYNFALNIGQHVGFERQKELLGANDGENDPMTTIQMAMDFNRFALTLDLDFIYEKVDDDDKLEMKATGSISTNEKVFVSLYKDSCSWRMILFDKDYNNATEQRAGIPLKAKSGAKTIRDKDDNLVTFPYTGPEDMLAYFPEFNINLCDLSKKDSAFMMPINFPYGYVPQMSRDLNKSYKDEMLPIANHMFINQEKMEDNAAEGMDLAADIVSTLSESNITNPTGNPKLDKMQREYNIKLKQDAYKKDLSQLGLNKKSVFLFNANNGSTVFIDQTNDTKHDIDENTKLVKGQIHLRVVHDPVENGGGL